MQRVPYLAPVPDVPVAVRPEPIEAPASPRPGLSRSAELDLDQAARFLLDLDAEMHAADGPRTAYLLGLAEGHLANLVEILRAVSS